MRILRFIVKLSLFSLPFLCFVCAPSHTIEIPLSGGGGVIPAGGAPEKGSSRSNIAYLDIELIFNEHPMATRLKTEFEEQVEKRKKEMTDMEISMRSIQDVIASTTTEISKLKAEIIEVKKAIDDKNRPPLEILLPGTTMAAFLPPPVSTNTAKADPAIVEANEKTIKEKEAGIETMQNEYEKKQQELESLKKSIREELVRLEEEHTQTVLNDIYKILGKLAIEDNITIVMDKNNVLYGQASMDITAKVRDRLRGR